MSTDTSGYEAFVEKFKTRRTTDDCFTPPKIYEAVLSWLRGNANLNGREIVRPFYPGGDYKAYDYTDNCVVVDNPPFSIFREIVGFYTTKHIPFFLFGPHLTISKYADVACLVLVDETLTYENGARVDTSFVTNLFPYAVWHSTSLAVALREAERGNKQTKTRPKIRWGRNVTSAALMGKCLNKGEDFVIERDEVCCVSKAGGRPLFGGGFLVSDFVATRLERLERLARLGEVEAIIELTDKEKEIVDGLNNKTYNENNLFT